MALSLGEIFATLSLRDQLSPALKIASHNLKQAGTDLKRVGTQVQAAGSAMLPFSAAITGAGVAAFKFGKDFETTMDRVGNITDIGAENIDEMSQAVLAMAPTVGIGPTPLAEALLVVASTGLKGATALQVLESSARASAVGLGDTKDIARAVTAAMTAYGVENLSAAAASDKLFAAVRAGGAEATEFAGTLGRVVGIASQVGVSFDEVLASVATFTRLGVNAEEAVTALRGTMATLLKPSKDATDQPAAMGLSIDEVRKSVRERGLMATLTELVALTRGNDDALAAIVPNIRALAGIMGTAGAQADAYAENLAAVKNASGDVDRAFAEMSKTVDFQWRQALTNAQTAAITLFDTFKVEAGVFVSAIARMGKAAVGFAEGMREWPPLARTATLGIAGLLALAGPGLIALGATIRAVGFALQGLGVTAAATSKAIVLLRSAMYLLAPVVAAVAAAWAGWKLGEKLRDIERGEGLISRMQDTVARLAGRLMGLTSEQVNATLAAERHQMQLEAAGVVIDQTTQATDEQAAAVAALETDLAALTGSTFSYDETLAGLNKTSEKQVELLNGIEVHGMTTREVMEQLIKTQGILNGVQELGYTKSLLPTRDILKEMGTVTIPDVTGQTDLLAQTVGSRSIPTFREFQQGINDLTGAFHVFGLSSDGVLGKTLSGIQKIANMSGALNSIVGIIDKMAGKAGAVKNILGGVLDFIPGGGIVKGLGDILSGGVGLAVKGLGKLFGGLFGGKDKAATKDIQKMQEELLKTYGSMEDISKLSQALGVNLADAWGSKGQAGLKNFTALTEEFKAKLAAVNEEMKSISSEGGLASASLLQFIETMGDAPEVAAFVQGQALSAMQGLQQFLDNATVSSQATATSVAGAIGATFSLLIQQGMPITQVFETLGPVIDQFAAQLTQTGLDGGAAFAGIQALAALAKDEIAGPAIDAVAGLGQTLEGLHNAGLMNQEMFGGLAAQVGSTFESLMAQGFDGNQAMLLMQPTLQTIWELQEEFGFAVDEGTQALIDQAEQAGIVGAQQKDVQEQILDVLMAIGEALGADLPAAAQKAANAMAGLGDTGTQSMDDLAGAVDAVNFGSSPGGLKEIPMLAAGGARALAELSSSGSRGMNMLAASADRGFAALAESGLQATAAVRGELEALGRMQVRANFGIEGGGGVAIPIVPMARGGSGMATGPTLFLAGEAGPEPYAFGEAADRGAGETEPEWARRLVDEIRRLPSAVRIGVRDGIIQTGM